MKKFSQSLLLFLGLTISSTALAMPNIHFATEATYPPFESMNASGQIEGFDVDVMNALCKEMQTHCSITHQPFDSLIPSLKIRKFDAIIGALAITKDRSKQVNFTLPYYLDNVSFVSNKSAHISISPAGLKGMTIGVQGGTTFEKYLKDTYGQIVRIKSYTSNEEALLDMQNDRVDAFLGDTPFIIQWLSKGHDKEYCLVGKPIQSEKYFGTGDGIAVAKNNSALLANLNKALQAIQDNGTLKKIEDKYFGQRR